MFHQVVPEADPEQSDSTNKICRRVFTQPGSEADIGAGVTDVRFTPKSRHACLVNKQQRVSKQLPEVYNGQASITNKPEHVLALNHC